MDGDREPPGWLVSGEDGGKKDIPESPTNLFVWWGLPKKLFDPA